MRVKSYDMVGLYTVLVKISMNLKYCRQPDSQTDASFDVFMCSLHTLFIKRTNMHVESHKWYSAQQCVSFNTYSKSTLIDCIYYEG